MTAYIIKSSFLLLIFLFMYLFLQKENNLIFNRFYLIISIAFSLFLPLISYELANKYQIKIPDDLIIPDYIIMKSVASVNTEEKLLVNNFGYKNILIITYCIVTIGLALRFIINLTSLLYRIRHSSHSFINGYKLVLLDKNVSIHSFINSIFLNKNDYDQKHIDDELIEHEITHLKQLHSIDILFIELIQIFYWFNPLIYFFKSAIKINHEYLADLGVSKTSKNLKEYSEKIINYTFRKNPINLASGFNYLLIKKRLVMLKKSKNNKMKSSKLILVAIVGISALLILPSFTVGKANDSFINTAESSRVKDVHKKSKPVHVNHEKNMLEFNVKNFPVEGAIHRSFNDDLRKNDHYLIKLRFDKFNPKQISFDKKSENWISNNGISFGDNIGIAINANNGEIYKLSTEQIIEEVKDNKNIRRYKNLVLVLISSQINSSWEKIDQLNTN